MARSLSIVIPLLNEEETLVELHSQLSALADAQDYELQILFVDDGSTDTSWQVIEQLAAQDTRVEGIRFRRNFGKAAALAAGFKQVRHSIVVTMDADLQDDPAEVLKLVARLDGTGPSGQTGKQGEEQPVDVVSGWKFDRKDPLHKTLPSKLFNFLASRLTGVWLHDHNCGLKAYRKEALNEVELYGELHRFLPVLTAARGFKVAEVPVNHRPRTHGYSKYGASRLIKGLLDIVTVRFLTGYGDRPQHLLGGVGLFAFSAGSMGLVYLAFRWVVSRTVPGLDPVHLHETASLFYSLALCMVGSQFLSVALLAAMIAAYHTHEQSYSIAETIESSTKSTSV